MNYEHRSFDIRQGYHKSVGSVGTTAREHRVGVVPNPHVWSFRPLIPQTLILGSIQQRHKRNKNITKLNYLYKKNSKSVKRQGYLKVRATPLRTENRNKGIFQTKN